jgi:hypothetical protein
MTAPGWCAGLVAGDFSQTLSSNSGDSKNDAGHDELTHPDRIDTTAGSCPYRV